MPRPQLPMCLVINYLRNYHRIHRHAVSIPAQRIQVLLQRDNGEDRPRGTLVSYRVGTPYSGTRPRYFVTPMVDTHGFNAVEDSWYPKDISGPINGFTIMDCRRYFLEPSFNFRYLDIRLSSSMDFRLIFNLDFRLNSQPGHS